MTTASIPACPFLWSHHDVVNHHYRRYTYKSIQNAIKKAGLSVEYITYYSSILFPVVAIVRIFNKLLNRQGGTDIGSPPAIVNRILTTIFSSEKKIYQIGAIRLAYLC